jgi:hypothetical protein
VSEWPQQRQAAFRLALAPNPALSEAKNYTGWAACLARSQALEGSQLFQTHVSSPSNASSCLLDGARTHQGKHNAHRLALRGKNNEGRVHRCCRQVLNTHALTA